MDAPLQKTNSSAANATHTHISQGLMTEHESELFCQHKVLQVLGRFFLMLGLINVCVYAHAYVPFYVVSLRSANFFVSFSPTCLVTA